MKDVQELLIKRSVNYSERPRMVLLNEMVKGDWLLPFMPYNEQYRRTRKIFHQLVSTSAITRPNEVAAVRRLLRRLLDTSRDHDKHFRLMTGDFILSSAYGIIPTSLDDVYISRTQKILHTVSESNQRDSFIVDVFPFLKWTPAWLPGANFKRHALKTRTMLQEARMLPWTFVKEQMAKGTAKPSLTSRFLVSLEGDSTVNHDHEIRETRSALGNVYLGASDTTMAAMWSCILALALHPDVQKKGQAAVDAALDGRLPDFSDWGTIPYIDAIVNESLRWNPVTPLGVPHCAAEDDYYNGILIPKGTMVFGNIWSLLRNEEVYGPHTDKFIPERFITKEGNINTDMDMDIAFGFGRRICPGKDMAREVLWLAIASLLATFDIGKPIGKDGNVLVAEGIDEKFSQRPVNLPPYFQCTFRPRSANAELLIRESVDEA